MSVGIFNAVGGLVGSNEGLIEDSFSFGDNPTSIPGGLCGIGSGIVRRCYSRVDVSGTTNNQARSIQPSGTVENSYYIANDLENDQTLGTALLDEQMKQQSSYEGWDFENVWIMREYPELRF